MQAQNAQAVEFFGDFLYWQATEPVDWTLNTNRLPADQFVDYHTVKYDFEPGFRIGIGQEGDWDTHLYYTNIHISSEDSISGNLTPAFLGGKLSLSDAPAPTPPYYDQGGVKAVIDYHVVDWDFGKRFQPCESLSVRPLIGLKAGSIHQTFDSEFQGEWPALSLSRSLTEHMENRFWGIGPKIGLENTWNGGRTESYRIRYMANFYTAYLLGHWNLKDVTDIASIDSGVTKKYQRVIPLDDRNFGAITFRALVGIHFRYRRWTAVVGYEINDWLNQCQIFDDATGPHNNDLILQGLTVRMQYKF
jgi:hypothetical protein